MCGIVGYNGTRSATQVLIEGLKRLEYRGYDSTGVAFFLKDQIQIEKSEGRLKKVEKLLLAKKGTYSQSSCGIGHTRWATHGKATTQNAHPHRTGSIVLVHNGIIENYLEIKKEILSKGYCPESETDSELFGFLVFDAMQAGADFIDAVRMAFIRLQGQCSVVVVSEKEPGVIVSARKGSPLVVAEDPCGGGIVASDAQALFWINKEMFFLEEGDMAILRPDGIETLSLKKRLPVPLKKVIFEGVQGPLDKGQFAHFMLKEIYEQPDTLIETFNQILDRSHSDPFQFAAQPGVTLLDEAQELCIVGCGTSWHAALLGRYWIEKWGQVPVTVEISSELRYRHFALRPKTLVIGLSQSGETADTLAVLKEMKKAGIPTLGISNVRGSSIAREVNAVFYTSAGIEIGVAATKTFISQMLVLLLIAGYLGMKKKEKKHRIRLQKLFDDMIRLPHLLSKELENNSIMVSQIIKVALELKKVKGFFFIGRGYSFPMALEGALKLKEIAYEFAEGYAAGELKHGPIAMIDRQMVVVVLAPRDSWRDKTASNLQEVKSRGAKIVGIGDSDDHDLYGLCDFWISLPPENRSVDPELLSFILAPALQLFSYHRALMKGTDVDKPRNLAKSVTVE